MKNSIELNCIKVNNKRMFNNLKTIFIKKQNYQRLLMQSIKYKSVVELSKAQIIREESFNRIFEISSDVATCIVAPQLSQKYGLDVDNSQYVTAITNKFTNEQTWYNEIRKNKPQTFKNKSQLLMSMNNNCDFCNWKQMTSEDNFGRIEYKHVITGSNLFKYCTPCHGILVFKEHDPYSYSYDQIKDLMYATIDWLNLAYQQNNSDYPLFVWNCLARAGASQFHAHAQVMLSKVPFPWYTKLIDVSKEYQKQYNRKYFKDLLINYDDVNLIRSLGTGDKICFFYPSLTPCKDMDICIWTKSIKNDNFCYILSELLNILKKEFNMLTFNVGIQGIKIHKNNLWNDYFDYILTRIIGRGDINSSASDFGGLELFGGASIGHTDPFDIIKAIDSHLPQLNKSNLSFEKIIF